VSLGILLPVLLLLAGGVASLTHSTDVARTLLRIVRNIVAAEFLLFGIAALVGFLYQSKNVRREDASLAPPGRLIDIGSYRLHLYCSGSGSPTVILDFGLDGSYLDWFYVQPQVAQFARVCSYDRAGYGWSDPSPKSRLPSIMSDELHRLLEGAGEEPPYIVVGHSFGAFDVRMYAQRFADEIAGVVLVDGSHPDELLPFYWQKKVWIRWMQLTMPFGLPRWRGWCGGGPPQAGPVRQAIGCRSKPFATHYAQWSAFPASAQEVRSLGTLGNLPLIVISRDPDRAPENPDDPVFEKREQHWWKLQHSLTELSTNTTQIIAKGSGHSIPSARPDVIVAAVRTMVENLRTQKRPADQ
jgi:pimeloyl-ACP methyl ester carboxylesterase